MRGRHLRRRWLRQRNMRLATCHFPARHRRAIVSCDTQGLQPNAWNKLSTALALQENTFSFSVAAPSCNAINFPCRCDGRYVTCSADAQSWASMLLPMEPSPSVLLCTRPLQALQAGEGDGTRQFELCRTSRCVCACLIARWTQLMRSNIGSTLVSRSTQVTYLHPTRILTRHPRRRKWCALPCNSIASDPRRLSPCGERW